MIDRKDFEGELFTLVSWHAKTNHWGQILHWQGFATDSDDNTHRITIYAEHAKAIAAAGYNPLSAISQSGQEIPFIATLGKKENDLLRIGQVIAPDNTVIAVADFIRQPRSNNHPIDDWQPTTALKFKWEATIRAKRRLYDYDPVQCQFILWQLIRIADEQNNLPTVRTARVF